jgi:hypothetical protein
LTEYGVLRRDIFMQVVEQRNEPHVFNLLDGSVLRVTPRGTAEIPGSLVSGELKIAEAMGLVRLFDEPPAETGNIGDERKKTRKER